LIILVDNNYSQIVSSVYKHQREGVDIEPIISFSHYYSVEVGSEDVVGGDVDTADQRTLGDLEQFLESVGVSHRPGVSSVIPNPLSAISEFICIDGSVGVATFNAHCEAKRGGNGCCEIRYGQIDNLR